MTDHVDDDCEYFLYE